VQRLNGEGRGTLLGAFKGEDKILSVYQNGDYRLSTFDLSTHFEEDMVLIEKWKPDQPLAAVYWDAAKKRYYVKRFLLDDIEKKDSFISNSKGSYLELITTARQPVIEIAFKKVKGEQKEPLKINLEEFISVKGRKAQGNQLTTLPVKDINLVDFEEEAEQIEDTKDDSTNEEDDKGDDQITLAFND
jgi:topoisomerase-4 subunit A